MKESITSNGMKAELRPFSLYYYLWTNLLTLGVIFTLYKLLLPTMWSEQISFPLWLIAVTLVVTHFVYAFVEYFFTAMSFIQKSSKSLATFTRNTTSITSHRRRNY